MESFQEVAESQKTQEENKDASATAEALEKLSVEEKNEGPAAATEEGPAAATEAKTESEENEKKEEEKKAEDSSA